MTETIVEPIQPQQVPQTNRPQRVSILERMANKFHVEPNRMLATLKQTAFKQQPNDPEVTNEQMIALLVVADQYGLNPFTKEIFAFPDKRKGIIPIVSVDGWSRIINSNSNFDGMEFEGSESLVQIDEHGKAAPEWLECVMYRKDREHPTRIREYLDEVYRPPFVGRSGKGEYIVPGPWQSHTKRMLRHKAMIQCARMAFGYSDIYDQDEGERIIEGEVLRDTAPALAGDLAADDLNASLLNGDSKPAIEAPKQDAIDLNELPVNQKQTEPVSAKTEDKPKRRGRPRKNPPPPQEAAQTQTADVETYSADSLTDRLVESSNPDEILELQDFANSLEDPQEKAAVQAIADKRLKELGAG